MEEWDLLRAYVEEGSEDAFRRLVERYTPLVYASARRQARDPDLAEDVTQAVFIIFSQKARRLRKGTVVAGVAPEDDALRRGGRASASAPQAAPREEGWRDDRGEKEGRRDRPRRTRQGPVLVRDRTRPG